MIEKDPMEPEKGFSFRKNRSHVLVFAIWCVAILLATILSYDFNHGMSHTVTSAYRTGALLWLGGESLYEQTIIDGHIVIYPPQNYIISIPFALADGFLMEMLWRVAVIGLWGYAVFRMALHLTPSFGQPIVLLYSILVLLLAMAASRIGQYTLPLAGTMMLMSIALTQARWNAAAGWMLLGMLIKPFFIPFFGLTFVLFRPMRLRLLGALTAFLLFPFLFQSPDYVLQQYRDYPRALETIGKIGYNHSFPSLLVPLHALHLPITPPVWTLLQGAAALLTLVLSCRLLRQKRSRAFTAIWFYSLPCLYLVLMNTRSENNGYAMIAPLLATYALMEWHLAKNYALYAFLVALIIGFIGHYEIAKQVVPQESLNMVCPVLTIVFIVYLFFRASAFALLEKNRMECALHENDCLY